MKNTWKEVGIAVICAQPMLSSCATSPPLERRIDESMAVTEASSSRPAIPFNEKKTFKEGKYGSLFYLSSLSYGNLRVTSDAIPDAVLAEAQDPHITNPYSGHTFDKTTIGTYDAHEKFKFVELDLGVGYQLPKVPLYVAGEIELVMGSYHGDGADDFQFGLSSHDGTYGSGYTYSNLLAHGGVDYVRYFYGMDVDLEPLIKPKIGLQLVKNDTLQIAIEGEYQRVDIDYYKGIEAFGSEHHYTKLAEESYDVYETNVLIGGNDEEGEWNILLGRYFGDGIEGFNVGLSWRVWK